MNSGPELKLDWCSHQAAEYAVDHWHASRIKTPVKHKYLMPLDGEMRRRFLPLARPYPKRVTSDTIDTASVQGAKGGETPTVTLQMQCA
jgi:hypothetical protein